MEKSRCRQVEAVGAQARYQLEDLAGGTEGGADQFAKDKAPDGLLDVERWRPARQYGQALRNRHHRRCGQRHWICA
jgi:hypothetical protein